MADSFEKMNLEERKATFHRQQKERDDLLATLARKQQSLDKAKAAREAKAAELPGASIVNDTLVYQPHRPSLHFATSGQEGGIYSKWATRLRAIADTLDEHAENAQAPELLDRLGESITAMSRAVKKVPITANEQGVQLGTDRASVLKSLQESQAEYDRITKTKSHNGGDAAGSSSAVNTAKKSKSVEHKDNNTPTPNKTPNLPAKRSRKSLGDEEDQSPQTTKRTKVQRPQPPRTGGENSELLTRRADSISNNQTDSPQATTEPAYDDAFD